MFRTIEAQHVANGVLDVSSYTENDTVIMAEDLGTVRFRGRLNVRNVIVHSGVKIIFEDHAVMHKNVLGSCVFMRGVDAYSLNATGDVVINESAVFGEGRSVVENGSLMIRGSLSSEGDVVVAQGCCRITGEVKGEGLIACDDVWAPSLNHDSDSLPQKEARFRLAKEFGEPMRGGFLRRLIGA